MPIAQGIDDVAGEPEALRAPFGARAADEAHRPAERDRLGCDAGELLCALPDVREDQRDQLLEAFRAAEDVRLRLEGLAEECLEGLEQPPRGVRVRVDVRFDRRLLAVR